MKKTYILILGAILSLTSCGMIAQSTSSDDGARFQDGIYSSSPVFLSKEDKAKEKAKTDSLIAMTKESAIYLFGDKKDTIMIPENYMAKIQYDQKVGGTVVTVGEDPYSWRWDLENNYGYYYGPYSIGSSWYWSRHYSPYYRSFYGPYYGSYYGPYYGSYWNSWRYDPWYYGGYYDPWYYDPWYYGGYWGGYYGNYWGWHDPWHHYHHHCGWYHPPHHHHSGPVHIGGASTGGHSNRYYGSRSRTESYGSVSTSHSSAGSKPSATTRPSTGTSRGGMSVGNRTSRASSTSGRSTTSAPSYRRPASSTSGSSAVNSSSSSSDYTRGTSTPSGSYSRGSSSNSYNHSSSSSSGSYNRGYSSPSSGYSRGGSSYSRGGSSSGGYRR